MIKIMFNKIKFLKDKYNKLSLPVKASLWFVICNIIQKGISFITTPIFTRILTTDEYGKLSVFNSWLDILTIFATFELATGVFNKAMLKYEDDRDGYTSSSLILSTLITIGFIFIYSANNKFWNDLLELNSCLVYMIFTEILFSQAMSFWSIRNRFEFRYRNIVLVTIITNIIATILSLLLVILFNENRVELKVLGTLIVHVLVYSVIFIHILRRGKVLVNIHYWKYAINYNLPLIPHYLSQKVLNQSDRIMIERMVGASFAGIYTVAYQMAMVLNIITVSIHSSYSPWIFQQIKKRDTSSVGKITLGLELVICLLCFLFTLFAPEAILILGGEKYYEAIWVVPPVTMSIVFNLIYSLIANVAFYYEKTKLVMYGTAVTAVANIILNYIFIPKFGFVAAGYTTLVCYIVYSLVHYMFMLHVCKENNLNNPFYGKRMAGVAFLAVALSLVATVLYQHTLIRYLFVLLLVTICFVYRRRIYSMLRKP